MKLQGKIILLLIPLVLLPLLVLGWITYSHLEITYREKSYHDINSVIERFQKNYFLALQNTISNLNILATNGHLIRYVLTEDEFSRYNLMQRSLHNIVASYQKSYPEYYEIRLIMPDGYEDFRQVQPGVTNVTENEFNTDYFQKLTKNPDEISHLVAINPDNNRFALYISKPLILADTANSKPRLRAYLVITESLEFITDMLETYSSGESGKLLITTRHGEILRRSATANNIDSYIIRGLDQYSPARISAQAFAVLTPSVTQQSIIHTRVFGEDAYLRGIELGEHLYLFIWLPAEQLTSKTAWIKSTVAIITSIAVLLTISMLFFALKYFVIDPIDKLDKAAQEIGQGQLKQDLNLDRQDEMGSLAKSLMEMNRNLEKSHQKIRHIAYHDTLTGLPNRLMFKEYLTHSIANAQRDHYKLGLLFIDLDNFKWVNDTLGHDAGDALLIEISHRLNDTLRHSDFFIRNVDAEQSDIIARLGGDEFIVLLSSCGDNFTPCKVAGRILNQISQPVHIQDTEVHVGCSIGITMFPDDADDADSMIKNADIAMYYAKGEGKNNFQYFSDSMNEAATRRLNLESRLRSAIEKEQLYLLYQPQIDLQTGDIMGVEALLRWNDPDTGVISPLDFIPVAEETGLITAIGEWVLLEACRQTREWLDMGLPEINIAVNVSGIQFSRQNFLQTLDRAMTAYGIPPRLLEVELTESIFIDNQEQISTILQTIREMGVQVSLDDFGTGYSSLGYLRQLPMDNLKIDRCFIAEINHSHEGEAVITAIISMAHAMKLKVIAEGVENANQLAFLRQHQCDYVQGYYFYRPMTGEAISELLQNQQKARPR